MNPEKPGWQTSEFWISLLMSVVGLLAMLGLIPTGDTQMINNWIVQSVERIVGMVVTITSIWKYIQSRIEVKVAALHTSTQLRTAVLRSDPSKLDVKQLKETVKELEQHHPQK